MEDKFSIFVPIELQKATDNTADKYHNMRMKGVASTIHSGRDTDGEILEVDGMITKDLEDAGFINWHHLWTKEPSMIIGQPTKVEIKGGELHIEGKLYSESQKARDAYDLAELLEKSGSDRRLGWSIEGKALSRDPKDKKRILKSRITGVALTPMPKNKGTKAELLKASLEDLFKADMDEVDEYLIDTTDANGVRRTVDKNLHIKVWNEDLNKAMVAGNVTGRDTTDQSLTMEPLKEEHVAGTKKKKKDKDKNKEMTKGEVIAQLASEGYDVESCSNMWELLCAIKELV